MHVEPDSVILRDPTGTHVPSGAGAELSRRSDLRRFVAQSLYEGKTIDFESPHRQIVKEK